jgi:quercetin dioxygenase-like cupin family protein
MSVAYTRPFHPLEFATKAAGQFALGAMIDQLQNEGSYRTAHRNALTLVRDDGLTAVATVARKGAQCEEHFSRGPTVFIVLEGELAIESAGDDRVITLPKGSVGVLAREIRHQLTAVSDCAYLMIMGRRRKAEGYRDGTIARGVQRHAGAIHNRTGRGRRASAQESSQRGG